MSQPSDSKKEKIRSRAWVFTINNWTDQDIAQIRACKAQYTIYGKEIGSSGTPHLQGYVYFKSQRTLSSLKKKISRAHWEVRRGTHDQAVQYCRKDGDVTEYGVPPEQNGGDKYSERAKRNKRLREASLNELVDTGEIHICEVRKLKNARLDLAQESDPVTSSTTRGIWIYGPPGTGKSHTARTQYGNDVYIKSQNKWFDGYSGEKVIILDDLDSNVLGHYLKIWTDKWSCSGEVKGGTVNLVHEKFIVTSNYHPRDLWPEDEMMRRAIERRFEFIEKLIKYQE